MDPNANNQDDEPAEQHEATQPEYTPPPVIPPSNETPAPYPGIATPGSTQPAQAKSKVWPIGIRIIAICVAIIAILSIIGLSSDSYSFVKPLSNYALLLMIPIALTAGVVAAHLTVRQPTDKQPASKTTIVLLMIATLIGLLIGLFPGIALLIIFGLRKARQHIPPGSHSLGRSLINAVLIILGFIVGVIPGLIFALLISYPLTMHACELSGSKYC